MGWFTLGAGVTFDMLTPEITPLPTPTQRSSTGFVFDFGVVLGLAVRQEITGTDFTYGADGFPTGGVMTSIVAWAGDKVTSSILDISAPASLWVAYSKGDAQAALQLLLAGDDRILGNGGDDEMRGGAGNDQLQGGDGKNIMYGDGGDDRIIGSLHTDTAGFAGAVANFKITQSGSSWIVTDTRTSAAVSQGTDTLTNVELLKFDDRTLDLSLTSGAINTIAANILRSDTATEISLLVGNGAKTVSQGMADLIKAADSTTTVATLAYQFFTGKIPELGGVDYLVSTKTNPNSLNSAYYQTFNLENRYINFAVNLGKFGDGKAQFLAKYGAMTLFDATREAYKTIFGGAPTDAKVHALIDTRVDYFASYGGDGATGIGTKAAMVGWLLGEAAKADVGMYAKASDAFLTDLADGATFGIDLVGVYGKAEYIYSG